MRMVVEQVAMIFSAEIHIRRNWRVQVCRVRSHRALLVGKLKIRAVIHCSNIQRLCLRQIKKLLLIVVSRVVIEKVTVNFIHLNCGLLFNNLAVIYTLILNWKKVIQFLIYMTVRKLTITFWFWTKLLRTFSLWICDYWHHRIRLCDYLCFIFLAYASDTFLYHKFLLLFRILNTNSWW